MDDPHVHVDARLGADAAVRDAVASTFGLVGELPPVVDAGCGLRVPRASTSSSPERVTCLARREHARRLHPRYAEQAGQLGLMPGVGIAPEKARRAANQHRSLAERYAGPT
jgi:hypothetical protein